MDERGRDSECTLAGAKTDVAEEPRERQHRCDGEVHQRGGPVSTGDGAEAGHGRPGGDGLDVLLDQVQTDLSGADHGEDGEAVGVLSRIAAIRRAQG